MKEYRTHTWEYVVSAFEEHAAARADSSAVEEVVVFVALGPGEIFGAPVTSIDDLLALLGPDVDSGTATFLLARERAAVGLLEDGE